jgi:hypothetical protein
MLTDDNDDDGRHVIASWIFTVNFKDIFLCMMLTVNFKDFSQKRRRSHTPTPSDDAHAQCEREHFNKGNICIGLHVLEVIISS